MPKNATTAVTWTLDEVERIYQLPLLELVERARAVHRRAHPSPEVQLCHLLSIKTGGCPEDCAYCPQSARYHTTVEAEGLMEPAEVVAAAGQARSAGSTRFCMGAAWRQVKSGPEFDRVLEMVRGVAALGLEVCCTLGMLNAEQAQQLAQAGLTAYNHNLDTSPEFYGHIITTRTYEDRFATLANVRQAGITVCCGGILGMGESVADRIGLLTTLANLTPPPESVPINALVAVAGTPLESQPPVTAFEFIRAIATARILMPGSKVRLSAGRLALSPEAQALCFYAGANSIFVGDKLLTTPNPDEDHDHQLLAELGLRAEPSHGAAAGVGAASGAVEADWGQALDALEGRDRRRALRPAAGLREDFCSNDYLGLRRHAAIRAALTEALAAGLELGSGGSRLVRGNHPALEAAERQFAGWQGQEAALLFSSGYAANVGLLSALLQPGDVAFSDALNHASLIDGMRLAGAERVVVAHLDLEALGRAFRRHPVAAGRRRWLVIESVFSMEADLAPLEALAALCGPAGVRIILDEAHATGLFGPSGAGRLAGCPAARAAVAASVHPGGKALGASGAMVAGSRLLIDTLINRSRSFIFSTAPAPLLGVQWQAAMDVIEREPERRSETQRLARALRQALADHGLRALGATEVPIVPVVLGSERAALAAEQALAAGGMDARAIRPPSVPDGQSRLRLTVHAGQDAARYPELARILAQSGAGLASAHAGGQGEAALEPAPK
ncbi:MAG: biotin synthase BioB [Terriglobales bacterium]